nr:hypothetical protein Iba_chr09aCG2240 [Ipomoea batatas]GMD38316.1 hypothetical protein Iba_chr09fCG2790 [Ipomoea batatas]
MSVSSGLHLSPHLFARRGLRRAAIGGRGRSEESRTAEADGEREATQRGTEVPATGEQRRDGRASEPAGFGSDIIATAEKARSNVYIT